MSRITRYETMSKIMFASENDVEMRRVLVEELEYIEDTPQYDLATLERVLSSRQSSLVDAWGNLRYFIEDEFTWMYAYELAKHYYPKKAESENYLRPVILSFAADLILAPVLHSQPQLWRYNYDDLDLLTNFYKFTHKQNNYFHVAQGILPKPTKDDFARGLELLSIKLDEYFDELWMAYNLRGGRARVAARVIEAVGGLAFDKDINGHLGFADSESIRNLRVRNGLGKFRYLRRGRQWMSIGTKPSPDSIDLRRELIADLWGYQIRYDKKDESVKVSVSSRELNWGKAQMTALLEADTFPGARLKNVSDFYRDFHRERRFTNTTNWFLLDEWLLTRTQKLRRAMGKGKWKLFLVQEHPAGQITYLPRRSNFFWDVKKNLNCAYKLIWNPYPRRSSYDLLHDGS